VQQKGCFSVEGLSPHIFPSVAQKRVCCAKSRKAKIILVIKFNIVIFIQSHFSEKKNDEYIIVKNILNNEDLNDNLAVCEGIVSFNCSSQNFSALKLEALKL